MVKTLPGKLAKGETVLILGASGGVGGPAIQLAKSALHMKKLDAHHTVDYEAGPVAEAIAKIAPAGVDLLFDAISGDTLLKSIPALKRKGRLVSVLNEGTALKLPRGVCFVHVMAQPSVPDLDHLRELAEASQLKVPVSATFPLTETKKAFEQIESKHTTGKVVIVP